MCYSYIRMIISPSINQTVAPRTSRPTEGLPPVRDKGSVVQDRTGQDRTGQDRTGRKGGNRIGRDRIGTLLRTGTNHCPALHHADIDGPIASLAARRRCQSQL